MTTLAQLTERVRNKAKDPELGDGQIGDFLNDCQNEILGEAEYMFLERYDDPVEVSGGELDLPRDWQQTEQILVNKKGSMPRRLRYLPFREYFDKSTEYAYPDRNYTYTVFSNKVFFTLPRDNKPCAPTVGGLPELWQVRHMYLAKPKQLVKPEDKAVIPDEFSECLVLGALARVEQWRDNFDFAQIYENKQLEVIENMKRRFGPRQNDSGNRARLPYGHKVTI
ncbi:MAG: hypothetical protein ACK5MU_04005 [Candidatus Saccharimonadales bacterium]